MIVGRILGWILVALSLAALVWDFFGRAEGEAFRAAPLGQRWFQIDAGSLNALQAGVERYVSPELWDSVFFPLLEWPAFLFPLVPGLLLVLLCRRWRRSPRRKP